MSPEGWVRYTWKQANENARSEEADQVAESALRLCFRGRRFERFGGDASAPKLLNAVAMRFHFRLGNIKALMLSSTDSHSYMKAGKEDQLQAAAEHRPGFNDTGTAANAFFTHIIPAQADGEWQEAILPVVHRSYVQKEQGAMVSDFVSDDILVRCAVSIANPASKQANQAASKLEMKDFELLVVP